MMVSMCQGQRTKHIVLVGVFFLNLSGGFTVFYGNLYAYVESYYRFHLPPDQKDLAPEWVLSTCLIFLPLGSVVADAMKFKLGLRVSVFIGVVLYGVGFLLSYLSVMHSVWATAITFGVLGIFGVGIVEVLSYCFTSSWFPERQGLAGSVVTASGSIGAILYNTIMTAYINPRNLKPDVIEEDRAYFSQPDILDRVPIVFIILGAITFITQLLGFLMTKERDFDPSEADGILKKSTNKEELKRQSTSESSSDSSCLSISKVSTTNGNGYIALGDGKCESDNERSESSRILSSHDHVHSDVSPKQMLKSVTFYLLWFSLIALSLGVIVVSNYYKFFAQVWIPDDTFLTLVGNSSAISSTFVRILMGFCLDKFRVKTVFIGTLSIMATSLVFWYYTAMLNRWMYFVCTNMLAGLTSTVFVLYPLASIKFFGLKYFASNTGVIMLAMMVTDLVSAPLVTTLKDFGWFWLFFTVGALLAVSLFAIIIFMPRNQMDR